MARGRTPIISSFGLLLPLGAVIMTTASEAEAATPTYYNSLPAFQADITTTVTDDYQNPAYVFIQSNAVMSAVLGQTDYFTTGFGELNIVSGGVYCAGCNGSFELSFQTTTVGNAAGVHGVGMNIQFNDPGTPYFAYITFADGTTANIQLPGAGSFWGVSAPERVERIHFGLSMGGTTQGGSFGIDNLVIGSGNVGGCMNAGDCTDDLNPCTDQACVGGTCQYPFNTAPCNDGEVCTEADACSMGVCQGALVACNDGNPCTTDFCDFGSGCAVANNDDPCNDGNACTNGDACSAGACGGAMVACDDANACTADSCDPDLGCVGEPIEGCCTDDAGCGADETCDTDTNTCVPIPSGSTGGGESSGGGEESTGAPPPADTGVDDTGGSGSGGVVTSTGDTGLDTGTTGLTGLDTGSGFDQGEAPDFSVCDCTTAPAPQGRLWWLMLPLGLALRRRRRAT
jgi:MYXO-CTERM domain-containing protein